MIEVQTFLGSVKFETKKSDELSSLVRGLFPAQWHEVDVIIFNPKDSKYNNDSTLSYVLAYLRSEGFIAEDGNFLIQMGPSTTA